MTTFVTIMLAVLAAQVIFGVIGMALVMSPRWWKWCTNKTLDVINKSYENLDC